MRNLMMLIFIAFTSLCFSQNDTISAVDVKIKYDSILKRDLYYEKINKKSKDFFDDDNYRLIENKVIREANLFKNIENGKLTKTETTRIVSSTKMITLYDKDIEYSIFCKDHTIYKIEMYEHSKLIFRFNYGLFSSSIEEFKYTQEGCYMFSTSNGEKTTYLVVMDSKSNDILSKTKISTEVMVGIDIDADGNYFFNDSYLDLFSELYEKFSKYCE